MIDLDKEREAFELVNKPILSGVFFTRDHIFNRGHYQSLENNGSQENAYSLSMNWFSWLERAELAQAEITELKQNFAESEAKQNMWRDEKNHAIKRWNDISRDYNELKQKIARYENPDYVLVPKNSKTVVAIENMVEQQVEASGIDEPIHRLDGWRILDAIEESMIEAVEKNHE